MGRERKPGPLHQSGDSCNGYGDSVLKDVDGANQNTSLESVQSFGVGVVLPLGAVWISGAMEHLALFLLLDLCMASPMHPRIWRFSQDGGVEWILLRHHLSTGAAL